MVNSLFPSALCFNGMIVKPGVTCGFSPMALFSSLVLYRQGKAARRQVRSIQSKIQSHQFGLPCLWKNISSPPGLSMADTNLLLAVCLQKHLARGCILERCLQPLLATLARVQYKQAVLYRYIYPTALEKPNRKGTSYGENRII